MRALTFFVPRVYCRAAAAATGLLFAFFLTRGRRTMKAKFLREIASLGLPKNPKHSNQTGIVTEKDLEGLPDVVQRYMRKMDIIGKPRIWSWRGSFKGKFKPGKDKPWTDCEMWQYNTCAEGAARFFQVKIAFIGPIWALARDTYYLGQGRLLARLMDMFTVADEKGEKLDIGELSTYLSECIGIVPSMIFGADVKWSKVDDKSFDVSLTDSGTIVSARVQLDENDNVASFTTMDRFFVDTSDPNNKAERTKWTVEFGDWQTIDGSYQAGKMIAYWHLPSGNLNYADIRFRPGTLKFNIAPVE